MPNDSKSIIELNLNRLRIRTAGKQIKFLLHAGFLIPYGFVRMNLHKKAVLQNPYVTIYNPMFLDFIHS